jgi:hypothetical protein
MSLRNAVYVKAFTAGMKEDNALGVTAIDVGIQGHRVHCV